MHGVHGFPRADFLFCRPGAAAGVPQGWSKAPTRTAWPRLDAKGNRPEGVRRPVDERAACLSSRGGTIAAWTARRRDRSGDRWEITRWPVGELLGCNAAYPRPPGRQVKLIRGEAVPARNRRSWLYFQPVRP